MPFSVLLSLYYKEKPEYLRDSLKSVFNQTLRPDEVILIEDGPLPSELLEILNYFESNFPIFKRIRLQKNLGLGKALNIGLEYCSNELVARMDTDDICFPDRFKKQLNFMIENPDVDVCSSWVEEFEGKVENITSLRKVPATNDEISKYIRKRNPLNHPAVMFRKSAVIKVGGYKHFPLFEDWYLWARMFVKGAKFANIQEPLLHFRTSTEMFKRRGGIKYALDSTKFQWTLHNLGLISTFEAIKASFIRGGVYIMPNSIRAMIYSKFLRS